MPADATETVEAAFVAKYSAEQFAHSTALLGREPTGAELALHHDTPAHGIAGDHDEEGSATDEGA